MSNFQFHFQIDDSEENPIMSCATNSTDSVSQPKHRERLQEIAVHLQHEQIASNHANETFKVNLPNEGSISSILYIPAAVVEQQLKHENKDESLVLKAHSVASDLLPGEYEGGLKVWECSIDLLLYLNEFNVNVNGLNVLELGCGAGLPAIYCFLLGARVTFQDYNKEVIDYLTIPNVFINTKSSEKNLDVTGCKFYSGDWSNFLTLFLNIKEDDKFDFILTSETIYNRDNYDSLYAIFKCALKRTGKIFIAAKSCYFGVGGSLQQFKEFILGNKEFYVETCRVIDGGIKREICQLTF